MSFIATSGHASLVSLPVWIAVWPCGAVWWMSCMFNALSAKYPWDEVLTETQIPSLLYSPVNTYDKPCWFTDCWCSFLSAEYPSFTTSACVKFSKELVYSKLQLPVVSPTCGNLKSLNFIYMLSVWARPRFARLGAFFISMSRLIKPPASSCRNKIWSVACLN